nr:MAG TPA: hypothetical protein [Caudoviricetes sp.]DAO82511.1 MAG TPA: hypothetical protein [Caudoviricetes sp.]DAR75176.1 MAG TPA: hypothetical protein [Caudoviricetes sp.]
MPLPYKYGREAGIQISQRCREATVKKRRRKLTI